MIEPRWPHQQKEYEDNAERPKLVLAWEPRLGKTRAAIDFLSGQFIGKSGKFLITAPLVVCPQWADQLERHGFHVTRGYKFIRKEQLDKALFLTENRPGKERPKRTPLPTALVLNVDKLPGNKALLAKWSPDLYIGDECHQFQDANSQRTRAMRAVAKHCPMLRFLSGTMMPNNPGNLWPVMQLVDPDNWEPTMAQFKRLHLISDYMYRDKIIAVIDPDEIERRLSLCTSRLTRTEVFGSDETQVLIRDVPFNEQSKVLYKQVADEWVATNTRGEILDATHALARLVRLQQITAGYAVFDGLPEEIDNSKVRAAAEEAQQLTDNGENVVIFYRFHYERDMLISVLKERQEGLYRIDGSCSSEERHQAVHEFNSHKGQILVAQFVAGGIGISLASANYALFLTRSFSYVEDTQAKDRIYAPGKSKCLIYYERPKTIDKYISDVIAKKKTMNEAIMSGNLTSALYGD